MGYKRKKLIIKNLKTKKIKKYSESTDIYFEQMKYFIKKKITQSFPEGYLKTH